MLSSVKRYLPLTVGWGITWALLAGLLWGSLALLDVVDRPLLDVLFLGPVRYGIAGAIWGLLFAHTLRNEIHGVGLGAIPSKRQTTIVSAVSSAFLILLAGDSSARLLQLDWHPALAVVLFGGAHVVLGISSGHVTMSIARRGGESGVPVEGKDPASLDRIPF